MRLLKGYISTILIYESWMRLCINEKGLNYWQWKNSPHLLLHVLIMNKIYTFSAIVVYYWIKLMFYFVQLIIKYHKMSSFSQQSFLRLWYGKYQLFVTNIRSLIMSTTAFNQRYWIHSIMAQVFQQQIQKFIKYF